MNSATPVSQALAAEAILRTSYQSELHRQQEHSLPATTPSATGSVTWPS